MKNLLFALCFLGIFCSTVLAAPRLWECNRCKQQFTGERPPSFIKCPATNNTRDHWWIPK